MPLKEMETRKLTDLEAEFIDAVRNYKRAYPNGSDEFEWYIEGLYERCSKKIERNCAPHSGDIQT